MHLYSLVLCLFFHNYSTQVVKDEKKNQDKQYNERKKQRKLNAQINNFKKFKHLKTQHQKIEHQMQQEKQQAEEKAQQAQQQAQKAQEENNRLKQQLRKRGSGGLRPHSHGASNVSSEGVSEDGSIGSDASISFGADNNNNNNNSELGAAQREYRIIGRKSSLYKLNVFIKMDKLSDGGFAHIASLVMNPQLLRQSMSQSMSQSYDFDIKSKYKVQVNEPKLQVPSKAPRRSRFDMKPIVENGNGNNNNKVVAKDKVSSHKVKFFVFFFILFCLSLCKNTQLLTTLVCCFLLLFCLDVINTSNN